MEGNANDNANDNANTCEMEVRGSQVFNPKSKSMKLKFIGRIRGFSTAVETILEKSDTTGVNFNPFSFRFGNTASIIGLLPSTWEMTIEPSNTDQEQEINRDTKLNLSVVQTSGLPDVKDFVCNVSLYERNDPYVDISPVEVNQKKPTKPFGTLGDMMDASVENELSIYIQFELLLPHRTTGIAPLLWDVPENYGNLLTSGENSDFVIQVKGLDHGKYSDIKVHKAILGARSTVFQKILVSPTTPEETGTLIIDDLSPTCVDIMLKFIYTGNLEEGWKDVPEDMVKAADRYNLPLLDFFNQNLHTICTCTNSTKLRRLAKFHGLDIAIGNITNFMITNFDRIQIR